MNRAGHIAREVGVWARSFNSSCAAFAVPATQTTWTGGLFSFMRPKPVMPPLDVPMQGVDPITPGPVSPSPPPTETAALSNGIRIGCQNVMSPIVSVGVIVESGSVNETAQTEGSTQLIEAMAFKGTTNRTHFATIRQAENYGISLSAVTTRETTAYYASAPRDNIAAAMELLCDSVANAHFQDHILLAEKARLQEENNRHVVDPTFMATEGVMTVAYTGGLARPCFWQGADINADMLMGFHREYHVPSNMVVAASGAPLSAVESLANEFLSDLPSGAAPPAPPSQYVGGSASEHNTNGSTAVVAFETGGWKNMENAILSTVVQFVLGGGADFSSGGPGKGMHSRLYQRVLTRKPWITHCSAYANLFEDTGLMGILMSSPDPSTGDDLVSTLCEELEALARGVTAEEVARGKALCESQVHAALEMPTVVAEDIGRQIISYGHRVPLEEFTTQLENVDVNAVQKYAQNLISGTPSGVLLGDQAYMPKFEAVQARFS